MAGKKRKFIFIAIVVIVILAIMLFSQSKNNLVRQLRGPAAGARAVYTCGDKLMVVSGDNEVYSWQWNDLKKWPTVAKINTNLLCPIENDKIIYALGGKSNTVIITDLKGQKQIVKIALPFGVKCKMLAPSTDCSHTALLLTQNGKEKLAFVGPDLKLSKIFKIEDADEDFKIYQIAISNNAKYIAVCGQKQEHAWFVVLNTKDGTILGKYKKAGEIDLERYDRLVFSPDSKKIFVGEKTRFIQMFDVETTALEKTFEISEFPTVSQKKQMISSLDITADGSIFAAATEPVQKLFMWNAETGEKIAEYGLPGPVVGDFAFSPNSDMAATSVVVRPTISIWKLPVSEIQ